MIARLGLLAAIGACFGFLRVANAAELEEILAAWQVRQERAQLVQYEWTETLTERTDHLPHLSIFAPVFIVFQEFDQETTTHDIRYAIELTSDYVWRQHSGVQWNSDTDSFLHSIDTIYRDAELDQALYANRGKTERLPEVAPSVAFVRKPEGEKLSYHSQPVALLYRPLDATHSFIDRESLKLTGETGDASGHDCVILSDANYRYWVDVETDYLIRRVERPHREPGMLPFLELEIEYVRHPSIGSVLSGWTGKVRYSGKPDVVSPLILAKVTNVTTDGEPRTRETLTAIPAGTSVLDYRGDERRRYILLADGREREVTRDDTRAGSPTYAELAGTETGHAIPQHFIDISERVRLIGNAEAAKRDAMLADLKQYLSERRMILRHYELARSTVRRLFNSAEPEAAIRMCQDFASISDNYRRAMSPIAAGLAGDLRRNRLMGNPLELTGTTVTGKAFDWPSYRGNVVLVDFWYLGCQPCMQAMPKIRELYEQYHAAGFEVVGLNTDTDRDALVAYLEQNHAPWQTIHEPRNTENANVTRYNITGFPTNILIDREGNVLKIGHELDAIETRIKEELKK